MTHEDRSPDPCDQNLDQPIKGEQLSELDSKRISGHDVGSSKDDVTKKDDDDDAKNDAENDVKNDANVDTKEQPEAASCHVIIRRATKEDNDALKTLIKETYTHEQLLKPSLIHEVASPRKFPKFAILGYVAFALTESLLVSAESGCR